MHLTREQVNLAQVLYNSIQRYLHFQTVFRLLQTAQVNYLQVLTSYQQVLKICLSVQFSLIMV